MVGEIISESQATSIGIRIQVKLDELIRTGTVQNSFIGIGHLTADELEDLRARCEERAKAVAREGTG
ncbi:low affinity iron permease family protein [Bradyrhizobium sp. CB1650]|uniref:low affinity iron permease family protein n=1 Tax=Bradyrhizobium sp. CB1650 TaxID=3039153 RepID=UPI00325F9B87